MDLRSRGLLPEALMICPYDKSHQVSEGRFYHHFYKCRRNWMANKALEGEEVFYLTCKHNHYHRVPEMEIVHHESTCADGKKMRSYQLRDGVKKFFLPIYYEQFKKHVSVEEERKEMYDGLKPGVLFSTELLGEPITFEELDGMSSEDINKRRGEILKKVMPKEWLYRCGRMSQEEYAALEAKEELEKKAKAAAVAAISTDDDDNWNTTAEGPGFDFWQNIWDPNVRHASVPLCLSKVERKLFMKIHAKRWERERQEKLELQRNPMPGTLEYFQMHHRVGKAQVGESRARRTPPSYEPDVQITKREKPRERAGRRVRFNTGKEEEQFQGAIGEAGARPVATPPPASSAFDKVNQFTEQRGRELGGAAAFLVENENIAEIMENYQFDDDGYGWVQPGLVVRNSDPYWGTGNKNDEYEITVRKVNRTRK